MKNSYFSRETTGALKGIALILMFVHHFFTFPGWITCGVEYPWIQEFTNQFVRQRISACVSSHFLPAIFSSSRQVLCATDCEKLRIFSCPTGSLPSP